MGSSFTPSLAPFSLVLYYLGLEAAILKIRLEDS